MSKETRQQDIVEWLRDEVEMCSDGDSEDAVRLKEAVAEIKRSRQALRRIGTLALNASIYPDEISTIMDPDTVQTICSNALSKAGE